MPRRSAADLEARGLGTIPRPPSARLEPSRGSADEQTVFRETVNSKPADYFGVADVPMLEAFSSAVIASRVIAAQLAAASTPQALAAKRGMAQFEWLVTMQQRQGRHLALLATKLRLCPQGRLTTRDAANASKGSKQKPWDE